MEKPPPYSNSIDEEFRPEIPNRTLNLWELSPGERQALAERIRANRGLVRIFVHPFFELHNYPQIYEEEQSLKDTKIRDVEIVLQRILGKEPEKTPPVIVFEEQRHLETTAKYLSLFAKESGNPAYLVPTREVSPVPKFTPIGVQDKLNSREAWQRLTDELRSLGVRKAIVGGMYLGVHDKDVFSKRGFSDKVRKDWEKIFEAYRRQRRRQGAANTDYYLFQCVGWTIGELTRAGIETEVSVATHPHSRREILEKEKGK